MARYIALWSIVLYGAAAATTRYVDLNNLSPAPPYTSWETAATLIQEAVNAAADHDEVRVADGHYYESLTIQDKTISLTSVHGATSTTIDANSLATCVTFFNSEGSSISGFKITGGYDSYKCGGIYCPNESITISNCIIESNYSRSIGGIRSGTIYNSIIRNNHAVGGYGGGITDAMAYNCIIIENSAVEQGGGIFRVHAYNCTFIDNRS